MRPVFALYFDSLTDGQIIWICAKALAYRPLMKACLIPGKLFPCNDIVPNRIVIVLNEGLGRLYAVNEDIKKIPHVFEPNENGLRELSGILASHGFGAYSPNSLYILNWQGTNIKNRDYILATYATEEEKNAAPNTPQ